MRCFVCRSAIHFAFGNRIHVSLRVVDMSDKAKQEAAPADGQEKPASSGGIVPWIAVGVISAGIGSAMPFMMASQTHKPTDEDAEHATADEGQADETSSTADGKEGSSKKKKKPNPFTLPKEEETIFLPFGEAGKDQGIVVNLDEGRMSRYLRIAITMQIPKSAEEEFKKKVDAKKILLRNWLLSKISDLNLDNIRGAAGQNRLRREIRDHFNSVLCPDGYDQIYDVLFEEFNVQ
jgi:flagellar basal body-associated protein FliL